MGVVVLRGGPGSGQVVPAAGPPVVWRACLYERTTNVERVQGADRRVYEHAADCCEPYGRGNEDRCEQPAEMAVDGEEGRIPVRGPAFVALACVDVSLDRGLAPY